MINYVTSLHCNVSQYLKLLFMLLHHNSHIVANSYNYYIESEIIKPILQFVYNYDVGLANA